MKHLAGLLICSALLASATFAREFVPTPPGGGEGVTTVPAHLVLPGSGPIRTTEKPVRLSDKAGGSEKAGGVSIVVDSRSVILHCSVDVASDGTVYAAAADQTSANGWSIRVHRSIDGGDTWELWGEIYDPSSTHGYTYPCLKVAEGLSDMCFVVYERNLPGVAENDIRMVSSPLAAATADFSTEVTIMSQTGVDFGRPRLFVDDDAFSAYYMYVVAEGDDGAGSDIWFARSVNLGVLFESEYEIATVPSDNRGYFRPDVTYGNGGYVHVTWYFASLVDAFNDCVCYRRVPDYANGGLPNWDILRTLTSPANGIEEYNPHIAASLADGWVVIAETRSEDMGSYYLIRQPGALFSDDQGVTFDEDLPDMVSVSSVHGVAHDPDGARWVFAGNSTSGPCLQTAPHATPADWSARDVLDYVDDWIFQIDLALDPSRGGSAAVLWTRYNSSPGAMDFLTFDAEWRGEPGYPVPLRYFPVALDDTPTGAPAVADVDGDGDLEIVFTTDDRYVHALNHDGTELPGWPVDLVQSPTDGAPVAVGPVGPGGETYVVVGLEPDYVKAFDATGTQQWVYSMAGGPAYVSIGALGPPHPYTVVSVGGRTLSFLGPDGQPPDGVGTILYSGSGSVTAPAAIGDMDGNGVAEAVFVYGSTVVAKEMRSSTTLWTSTTYPTSGPVTLKDHNLDGDQEMVIPTASGFVLMLNETGLNWPGWPVDPGDLCEIGEVAVAQIVEDVEQDLAFTSDCGGVYLYRDDGYHVSGFPEYVSAVMSGGPVIGLVGDNIDLVFATQDDELNVLTNTSSGLPGWPTAADAPIRYAPAMGDLDEDGFQEIVWLTDTSCYAVSIGRQYAGDIKAWPMSRHDAKRTGCADCPEDVSTAVPGGGTATAHVSFRAPSPNPVSSGTVFAFNLPVRAIAELEIIDARGRRVSLVGREELAAGDHVMGWDGRDVAGRPTASGHYFARLHVRGAGLDDRLIRKVTVVR
jgi:hypothetical protein